MSWHYRILRYRDGALALHEVYCDEAGQPNGYTEQPIGFAVNADEGANVLRQALRRALDDATNRPILDVADLGGSTAEEGGKTLIEFVLPVDLVKAIVETGPGYSARVERVLHEALAKGEF